MFTANTLPGGYLVTATSAYGSVTFSLVNTASGIPATITSLAPTTPGGDVPKPGIGSRSRSQVLDAAGNPVQGAIVTFSSRLRRGRWRIRLVEHRERGRELRRRQRAGDRDHERRRTRDLAAVHGERRRPAGSPRPRPRRGRRRSPPASRSTTWPQGRRRITAGRVSRDGRQRSEAATRRPLQVKVTGARRARRSHGATVTFTLGRPAGASGERGRRRRSDLRRRQRRRPPRRPTRPGSRLVPALRREHHRRELHRDRRAADSVATGSTSRSAQPRRPPDASPPAWRQRESTAVGTRFPIRLAVTVTDTHGNAVAGALVTFTAPAHGPSGSFAGPHGRARRSGSGRTPPGSRSRPRSPRTTKRAATSSAPPPAAPARPRSRSSTSRRAQA